MTKNRKIIKEIVLSSDCHLTAEQIFEKARKAMPGISLATVYNNLKALCDAKVIIRTRLIGKSDCYDRPNHHSHMICTGCGTVRDFVCSDLAGMLAQNCESPILTYDLRVSYLCEDCRKAQLTPQIA